MLRILLGCIQILLSNEAPDLVFDDNIAKKTDYERLIESKRPFYAQKGYGLGNQHTVDLTDATMAAGDRVGEGFLRFLIMAGFPL